MVAKPVKLETRLIHAGEAEPRILGAGVPPIFRSTVWEHVPGAGYHDILYPRLSNLPNHVVLGDKLAALEGGESGLVTSSGMSAISACLLSLLDAGDHALVQDCLYGGTQGLFTRDLAPLGIEFDFVDANDPVSWQERLRPNTRVFYAEAITNPLLEIADHEGIVAFAKKNGLQAVIDSTFASPVNARPLEWGYDLVVHSGTKYLNGHSDVVAGSIVGRSESVEAAKRKLDHFGGALDPQAAYLLHRGLKTLALRVGQQNRSAQAIAEFLSEHPRVETVRYPGLSSHPQHERARHLFDGFGGMLSFELMGDRDSAPRLIDRLELALPSASLGGVETLITQPANTSHAGLSLEERARAGIAEGLIRFSTGIEAAEDLIGDLERALA
ncbi:PLP-dependent aspartate aminotransferase family protein [Myxococcota bacterium]|nr:PLP-dependent aspartate aminotransferase family protein [Myxococcota bacterium]